MNADERDRLDDLMSAQAALATAARLIGRVLDHYAECEHEWMVSPDSRMGSVSWTCKRCGEVTEEKPDGNDRTN